MVDEQKLAEENITLISICWALLAAMKLRVVLWNHTHLQKFSVKLSRQIALLKEPKGSPRPTR
jgi:hypothetical protein